MRPGAAFLALLLVTAAPAPGGAVPRGARDLGPVADDEPTETLVLAFAPRDAAALDALLRAQHDPSSPEYRRWLTPEEFAARFGPSPGAYAAATRWLVRRGFTDVRTWPGRLGIAFRGRAGDVARAFGARLHAHWWRGTRRTAPDRAPRLPAFADAPVRGLLGLDGFVRVHPAFRIAGQDHLAPADVARVHGLTGVYDRGDRGQGVTIAVLAVSDFSTSDVDLFRATFGLRPTAVAKRFVGANPGTSDLLALGEVLLDTEWSGAIAPAASIVAVIGSSDSVGSLASAALDAVNQNVAAVVSVSFGVCEPIATSLIAQQIDDLARQGAAQGMSVVVSSGDDGVADCRRQNGSLTPAVNALASSPWVTAVGGTALDPRFDADGNATGYGGERVWDDAAVVAAGGASGGGRSIFFAKPAYQQIAGIPADGARDVPDVAFAASPGDPGFALVGSGVLLPFGIGGTSASAPVWGGMAALLVQHRGDRLGLLNGELYRLGAEQAAGTRAPVFHDVTSGSNAIIGVRGFPAGPGYDLATGWGSFDAGALLDAFDPGPPCSTDADCPDEPCATSSCTPSGCRATALADGTVCHTPSCQAGACSAGICVTSAPPGCEDGDPCTSDHCVSNGACVFQVVSGAGAVACVLPSDLAAGTCADDRLPRGVRQRVTRARLLLLRTERRHVHPRKLAGHAARLLDRAAVVAARAADAGRLTPLCAVSLQAALTAASAQATHLEALLP